MYCPKCGQQNPDEAKFCGKCGAAVAAPATARPVSPGPTTASPTTASPTTAAAPAGADAAVSQNMKIGMIIASIVLPIVGIVMGIVYVLDANPQKKEAGKLWLIIGIIAAVIWSAMFGA